MQSMKTVLQKNHLAAVAVSLKMQEDKIDDTSLKPAKHTMLDVLTQIICIHARKKISTCN